MAQTEIIEFLEEERDKGYYYTAEAIANKVGVGKHNVNHSLRMLYKYRFLDRLCLYQQSGSPVYIYALKSPLEE